MPSQRDPDAPTPPEHAAAPTDRARAGLRAALEPQSPPHDGLLLPLLYDLAQPLIAAGRAHGPLPALRSDEFLDAHPDQQLAVLLIAGLDAALFPRRATVAALLKHASVNTAEAMTTQPDYITPWTRVTNDLRRANDRADRLQQQLEQRDAVDRAVHRRAS